MCSLVVRFSIFGLDTLQYTRLTGAKLILVIAASDTPEKVVATDCVTFATGIKALATACSPPPEHDVKPMWLIKACWPAGSRETWPDAEKRVSEYAGLTATADPEEVMHRPLDR